MFPSQLAILRAHEGMRGYHLVRVEQYMAVLLDGERVMANVVDTMATINKLLAHITGPSRRKAHLSKRKMAMKEGLSRLEFASSTY